MNKLIKFIYKLILYIFTLVLAFCSAGFTILFYTEMQEGIKQVLIGLLAFTFEMLKVTLAFSYPYMKLRNFKIEKSVKNTLNVCLLLSIFASIYFFLGQENVSPATKLIDLLFSYLGIEVCKNFFAFLLNMSLAIMIEVFIIKIPSYACIFDFEVSKNRQEFLFETSFQKIITIPKFWVYSKIDTLFQKHCKKIILNPSKENEIKVDEILNLEKNSQSLKVENENEGLRMKMKVENRVENKDKELSKKVENSQSFLSNIVLETNEINKVENWHLSTDSTSLEGLRDDKKNGREVEDKKEVENRVEVEKVEKKVEDFYNVEKEIEEKVENLNEGLREKIRVENKEYNFETLNQEEINIENFKNSIKNENDLLDVLNIIKNYDGIVNNKIYKTAILQEKLGLTNWELRVMKNKLKEKGLIEIEKNQIKVIKKVS